MGGKMTDKRDKTGEDNKKKGREKQERDVQGDGGKRGGDGGTKRGGDGGTKRSDRKQ